MQCRSSAMLSNLHVYITRRNYTRVAKMILPTLRRDLASIFHPHSQWGHFLRLSPLSIVALVGLAHVPPSAKGVE